MPAATLLQKLKKPAALLFLAFVALFLIRFLLGFVIEFEKKPARRKAMPALSAISFELKNYRYDCANNLQRLKVFNEWVPAAEKPLDVDMVAQLEVYTREAQVGGVTSEFDDDVSRALKIINQYESEIRLESSRGIKPSRYFSVVIRVPVSQFDDCVAALRMIGDIQSFNVTKQDKSEEVRQQFAEREALREHLESLTKLRATEGKVSELVSLETQIQVVQKQMRALSVSLGEFVKKESYNNINFSLTEQIDFFVDDEEYPISARVVAAMVWTTQWYFTALSLVAVVMLTRSSLRVVRQA